MREKFRQGQWPTKAPIGYLNRDNRIILDPRRTAAIKSAFQQIAEGGMSLRELSRKLHQDGFRTQKGFSICKSHLHQLLPTHSTTA